MRMPWDGMIERRVEAVIEERGYGDLVLAGLEATVTGTRQAFSKLRRLRSRAVCGREPWPGPSSRVTGGR